MLDLSRYDRVFLLTDEQVATCCLSVFYSTIMHQPYMADQLILPSGEQHKNLQTVQRIWDWLIAEHATRSSLLINLGGGVICDMGGFAAATYMRGISFINVPTTLLAMVDAAAGGKTGIDYGTPLLKNCIGVFAEPVTTVYEPRLLQSLPAEQVLSGYAEMIKHALLSSPEELNLLLEYDIRDITTPAFGDIIRRSVAFKQSVVEQDPHDHGLRQILNFGHTVGHAIEALLLAKCENGKCENGKCFHGYCVMYGIVAEAYLSNMLCGLPAEVVSTLSKFMLENYGAAPISCKDFDELLRLMQHDKKNCDLAVVCTLLEAVGKPRTALRVTPEQLREAIEYMCSL